MATHHQEIWKSTYMLLYVLMPKLLKKIPTPIILQNSTWKVFSLLWIFHNEKHKYNKYYHSDIQKHSHLLDGDMRVSSRTKTPNIFIHTEWQTDSHTCFPNISSLNLLARYSQTQETIWKIITFYFELVNLIAHTMTS